MDYYSILFFVFDSDKSLFIIIFFFKLSKYNKKSSRRRILFLILLAKYHDNLDYGFTPTTGMASCPIPIEPV